MASETEARHFSEGMFERMQNMNRSWLERLRGIRQIEAEYGARLLAAKTPQEATSVCNAWMAKRLETIAEEQQAFTNAWLQLVSGVLTSASEETAAVVQQAHSTHDRKMEVIASPMLDRAADPTVRNV